MNAMPMSRHIALIRGIPKMMSMFVLCSSLTLRFRAGLFSHLSPKNKALMRQFRNS